MISMDVAIPLARRFEGCRGFSFLDDTARRLLLDALLKCVDRDHAERAVMAWVENYRDAPTLADLRDMIQQTRPPEVSGDAAGCKLCRSGGLKSVAFAVAFGEHGVRSKRPLPPGGVLEDGEEFYTAAVPCDCPAGQAKRKPVVVQCGAAGAE